MEPGHAAHPFNRRCRSAYQYCSGIARLLNNPPGNSPPDDRVDGGSNDIYTIAIRLTSNSRGATAARGETLPRTVVRRPFSPIVWVRSAPLRDLASRGFEQETNQ